MLDAAREYEFIPFIKFMEKCYCEVITNYLYTNDTAEIIHVVTFISISRIIRIWKNISYHYTTMGKK